MRGNQAKKPAKDGHRYVIVIPEAGPMYPEMLDDGVRAVCRKVLGARRVDAVPCGMDARFTVLFSLDVTTDLYNPAASRLAQERLSGPCVVARGGRDDGLRGLSREGVKKAIADLTAMAAEGIGDV